MLKDSLKMVLHRPLLGWGFGTFYVVYPSFRSFYTNLIVNAAHNDFVELAVETGLVGFAIVAGGWFLFYFQLIRQWRRRRDIWARGVGLGGLAALAAGAFHALGEFPFHIPAYSLTYGAIAALTFLTLHWRQARKGFDYPAWPPAGSRRVPWLCVILVLVQAAYMVQAWNVWQAERAAPLGINSIRIPRTLKTADYIRALGFNPLNAEYFAGLAETLAAEGIPDLEQARKIEALLKQAIFLAPARWRSHYQLGNFLLEHYRLDPRRQLPRGLKELAAAAALFPEKAETQLRLGLALTWTELFYPAYVPPDLAKRGQEYLDRAGALEPAFKKFISPK